LVAFGASLNDVEDENWQSWNRGQGVRPCDLKRILEAYEITETTTRFDNAPRSRGYHRSAFDDAVARYLSVCTPLKTGDMGDSPENIEETRHQPVTDVTRAVTAGDALVTGNANKNNGVTHVTRKSGGIDGEASCAACDGRGCPTCKPEDFGLPPKLKVIGGRV
jgi:hypothetical protein